jgi:hypothetical protein
MKKIAIASLALAGLAVVGLLGVTMLASSAGRRADAAFNDVEPEATFRARFPAVQAKNGSAEQLERLALELQVDLLPKSERAGRTVPELDPRLGEQMAEWLKAQHERPDDSIDPLPDSLRKWLDGHTVKIDAVAKHLVEAVRPQWRVLQSGPPGLRPIPNLLGHMQLGRVLSLAALDAEMKGENERAWYLEHAAWKLAQPLGLRPEVISQLINVAGVKMVVATTRKLQPPAPQWIGELAALRPRDGIFRAFRYETAYARSTSDLSLLNDGDTSGRSFQERLEAAALSPGLAWAGREAIRAAAGEFNRLRSVEPCRVDAKSAAERARSSTSPVARSMGRTYFSAFGGAFTRAAELEIAIEGTQRILAAKAAHLSAKSWPASLTGAQRSVCRDARWSYESDGATARLRFTGRVPAIQNFYGTRVPTEYVLR